MSTSVFRTLLIGAILCTTTTELTAGLLAPTMDPFRSRQRYRPSREQHGSHYFLATSAIPLVKGHGYYKNTLVTLNSVAYGVTSHLAVSAGVDLFSMITSRRQGLWYTRFQLSGSMSNFFHLGVQAFYVTLPLPNALEDATAGGPSSGFGSGLAMVTIGNEAHQLTLKGGVLHDGQRFSRGPLLSASGMVRIATNVGLVTEHWLFSDPALNYPVHSLGVRILGDHLAIDVGIAYDRELAAKVLPIGSPFAAATLNF